MDIDELSKQIKEQHEEDNKRAKKERLENLAFVSLGFGLAVIGLAVKDVDIVNTVVFAVAAIFFLVFGIRAYNKSLEEKRK